MGFGKQKSTKPKLRKTKKTKNTKKFKQDKGARHQSEKEKQADGILEVTQDQAFN